MSEGRRELAQRLADSGIVAIVRTESAEGLVEAAEALLRGGVIALEITLSVPGALAAIELLAKSCPELLLGAGTVTRAEEVTSVVSAGAKYVVSPILSRAVVARCRELDVVTIPGCFTPTEMFEATDAGADFVKLFPATGLGPKFLRDVRAPLPTLRVIPTGGISVENAGDWIRAGAVAVGVGTALIEPKLVRERAFGILESRAHELQSAVKQARTLV